MPTGRDRQPSAGGTEGLRYAGDRGHRPGELSLTAADSVTRSLGGSHMLGRRGDGLDGRGGADAHTDGRTRGPWGEAGGGQRPPCPYLAGLAAVSSFRAFLGCTRVCVTGEAGSLLADLGHARVLCWSERRNARLGFGNSCPGPCYRVLQVTSGRRSLVCRMGAMPPDPRESSLRMT